MPSSRRAVIVVIAAGFLASCSTADGGATATTRTTVAVAASTTVERSTSTSTFTSTSTSTSTTIAVTAAVDPAAALADRIVAAEQGIRDPTLPAGETARWGREQQRAYRALAGSPELDSSVRARLPGDVLTAFDANVAARRATVDHAASRPPAEPSPTLPAWTIVEPRPIDELVAFYREAEVLTGVPWQYLAAINLVETRMGRIEGASSAGAVGPMQFLPETWAGCCAGDVGDPHDAIIGAAVYLVANGAPADMDAALFGYNPNAGYVGAVHAYALNMLADERAYAGYHAWEVYYGSVAGTIRLPVGYSESSPIDAVAYAAEHPEDVAPVSDAT